MTPWRLTATECCTEPAADHEQNTFHLMLFIFQYFVEGNLNLRVLLFNSICGLIAVKWLGLLY